MDQEGDLATVNNSTEIVSREELDAYANSYREKIKNKLELRRKNLDANIDRPDEAALRKLDSNLKKNTAFVKKIKLFTESQKSALIKDFQGLNLNKYVAEIAASVCEAKLKITDVPAMVELCSLIHQRYNDFSSALLDSYFKKTFPKRKDDQISNLSKFRVDLRLLADLIAAGVLAEKESLPVLGAALNYLVQSDKDDHNFLPLLVSFCKYCGEDFAGFIPRRYKIAAANHNVGLPTNKIFNADRQKVIKSLLKEYASRLNSDLLKLYKESNRLERRMQREYETKGEVHFETRQKFDGLKSSFSKLHTNICALFELIDESVPDLKFDEKTDDLTEMVDTGDGGMIIVPGGLPTQSEIGGGLWEDVETQAFYESLPELRCILPGILFKESEKPTLPMLEDKIDEEPIEDLTETDIAVQSVEETESSTAVSETQPFSLSVEEDTGMEENDEDMGAQESQSTNSMLKQLMESFVAELPNLVNRDLIDKAATDFVTNLNNKMNRNRLVKALFNVHRNRIDLLPFYARLVAILKPVMPDVSTELVQLLISDFRRRVRKKDQKFIEEKLKCARFIGELTKFKIFPKSEALHCFKILLFDFRHHSIDMASALLDTCGYFLYHSPDSHQKTKILLDQMMRKRQIISNLDQRYQLMIDNAYFTCIPPQASMSVKVERSPIEEYIRKLLFHDLNEDSVEKVLKQIRKLNWDDAGTVSWIVSYLSQPWLVKFLNVQWMASLLAGVTWYYDFVGHRVVDNILEENRIGMEINHHKFNQRRLCCTHYLGELYNYRLIDSNIIFSFLYSLITFGIVYDHKIVSPLDSPEHLFRIRLACVCLDTCGEYFDKGLGKKKLDIYLTYLQRYYWFKRETDCWVENERPFPVEISNLLQDTIYFLRPKLRLFESLDESNEAVKAVEDEYKEKIEAVLKSAPRDATTTGEEFDEEEEDDRQRVLHPIEEEADDDGAENDTECAAAQGGSVQRDRNQSFSDAKFLSKNMGSIDSSDAEKEEENGVDTYDDETVNVHMSKLHDKLFDEAVQYENNLFNTEFERYLNECMVSRVQEQYKAPAPDFAVPTVSKTKKQTRFDTDGDQPVPSEKPASTDNNANMNFYLMVKGKGSKAALKTLKLPLDSEWAKAVRDREIVEQEEKRRVKQLTLNMTQRMQEEEMNEEFSFKERPSARHAAPEIKKGHPTVNEFYSKSWL